MLSSTHTHSGPAGFLQYVLYIITSQGFIDQNFKAVRDGIVRSINRAHSKMTPGFIYVNSGQLLDTSINRSPTAYLNNNQAERARYAYDTDKNMTLLKFTDTKGTDLAVISWFAVHATSMNNTNKLISGDNKGYASMLFEQDINGGTLHGKVFYHLLKHPVLEIISLLLS
jgi:neutral ceramidase